MLWTIARFRSTCLLSDYCARQSPTDLYASNTGGCQIGTVLLISTPSAEKRRLRSAWLIVEEVQCDCSEERRDGQVVVG